MGALERFAGGVAWVAYETACPQAAAPKIPILQTGSGPQNLHFKYVQGPRGAGGPAVRAGEAGVRPQQWEEGTGARSPDSRPVVTLGKQGRDEEVPTASPQVDSSQG